MANDFLKWLGGLFGASEEEIDTALHASLSDTDTLTVGDGEGAIKYSCTVSDDAGNSEKSEWAYVTYKLRIAEEPSNVNLQSSENPALYCRATDGSGDYTYRWYTSSNVFVGKEQSLPISETGDYFCTVEDNVTGETIDSLICTVYSEKPLAPYSQTPYDYVWPGEKWTVKLYRQKRYRLLGLAVPLLLAVYFAEQCFPMILWPGPASAAGIAVTKWLSTVPDWLLLLVGCITFIGHLFKEQVFADILFLIHPDQLPIIGQGKGGFSVIIHLSIS